MRVPFPELSGAGSIAAAPAPGRACPTDDRYDVSVLSRAVEFTAGVPDVAGGVDGTVAALDAIEAMTERERGRTVLVLNGDLHWFDADPDWFAMHCVAKVGGLRIGIVHGDAEPLGGWRFDRPALHVRDAPAWLQGVHALSGIDLFVSTQACRAALRDFVLSEGRPTVINNGAARMPNFRSTRFRLASRIATEPSGQVPYGLEREGVHIEALPVRYDTETFMRRFLTRWPAGLPAHASYYRRLTDGPDDAPDRVQPSPHPRNA